MSITYCSSLCAQPFEENQVVSAFQDELSQLSLKYLPKDDTALIGRNYSWGKLYSPRFQMGAGRTLRLSVSSKNYPQAAQAFYALREGTRAIDDDGAVRSRLPWRYGRVSKIDRISAAAFYLGDACLGMLALSTVENNAHSISSADTRKTKSALSRGIAWLSTHSRELGKYDAHAPNRLLFDARSFVACGRLFEDKKLVDTGRIFIELALDALSGEGYFIEGKGWDTSYQAVAINVALDILLSGFEHKELWPATEKAAGWLAGRVDKRGRINSSGNTRTCSGGERFLGTTKHVAVDEVFLSLAYIGILGSDAKVVEKARAVAAWYSDNAGRSPCYKAVGRNDSAGES